MDWLERGKYFVEERDEKVKGDSCQEQDSQKQDDKSEFEGEHVKVLCLEKEVDLIIYGEILFL